MHIKWNQIEKLIDCVQEVNQNVKSINIRKQEQNLNKYTATCKNGWLSGAQQPHTLCGWTGDGRQPSHTAPENTAALQKLLLSKPRPDIQLQKRRQYNWRQSFKTGRIPVAWPHHWFLQHVPLPCPRLVSCFLTILINITEAMKQGKARAWRQL